jgi:amino acid transporter
MAGFLPLVVGFGNRQGAAGSFIVIGSLLLIFSVGLTAMSRFVTSPGAFYCYIAAGLGRVPGLAAAFVALSAYLALGAANYGLGGILADHLVHELLGGPHAPWWIWALIMWTGASLLSLLAIELSAKVLGVAMCAELTILVLWEIAVLIHGGPEGRSPATFTFSAFMSGSPGFGLMYAALCVMGFEAVAVFRQEARNPLKTVPRATFLAIGTLAGLYGIGAWVYVVAFGPSQAVARAAADPSGSFIESLRHYVGPIAGTIASALLVSSIFAAMLATQNISSRYLYALGRDGAIASPLGRVHPRHGSPYMASITASALLFVLNAVPAVLGLNPLTTYAFFASVGGFALLLMMATTSLAVFFFFRRIPDHTANAWTATVAPLTSFLGLSLVVILAGRNLGAVAGGSQAVGNIGVSIVVAIAACGAGLAVRHRKHRPEIYARIGNPHGG